MVYVFEDGFVMRHKDICGNGEEDLKTIRGALLNVLQYAPSDFLSDDDRCELVGLLRSLTEGEVKKAGKTPSDGKLLV